MTGRNITQEAHIGDIDDIDSYVATFSEAERARLEVAEAAIDIAMFLHDARESRGLSQTVAAQRAGLHQQAVSRFERPNANPRLETIRTYLDALGFGLELTAVDNQAGQLTATMTLPPRGGKPRTLTSPIRVLMPSAPEAINRGYAFMEASEVANRQYTIEHHANAVSLWGRALTHFREGIVGKSDFTEAAADASRLRALHAQSQLLGLGVNSAKASLDLLLNGYYSPAFSAIRHMVETFAQCTWLELRPSEASRWFDMPAENDDPLDPPRMRELVDQIKADLIRNGVDKDDVVNKLDPIYRSWKLMSKGAHPSGEGLAQLLGDKPGQLLVGGMYQPEMCVVAFNHGLFAIANLLPQALDWHKPQSAVWHEAWKRLEEDVATWRAEMAPEVSAAEEKFDEAA